MSIDDQYHPLAPRNKCPRIFKDRMPHLAATFLVAAVLLAAAYLWIKTTEHAKINPGSIVGYCIFIAITSAVSGIMFGEGFKHCNKNSRNIEAPPQPARHIN